MRYWMTKKSLKIKDRTITLDAKILKKLNIDEDTELAIKVKDGAIVITPLEKVGAKRIVSKDREVQKAYELIMKKYAPALKKLAKT